MGYRRIGYGSIRICALLPPVRLGPRYRRPILKANHMPATYETMH